MKQKFNRQELYMFVQAKKRRRNVYARDQIPPTGCGRGQFKKEYGHLLWRLSNKEGKDEENIISK